MLCHLRRLRVTWTPAVDLHKQLNSVLNVGETCS